MTVDLTLIADTLLTLAAAAVAAAIPIIVPALLKRLHLANDADFANKIETAATAGAGLAYRYAVAHEGGLAHVAVQDAALAAGVNHVVASVPTALNALGITPEHVAQMVQARLGQLLATDPTVTAGSPKTAPVTALQPAPIVAIVPDAAVPAGPVVAAVAAP